ncbi:C-type lectin 9a-like [Centroberyx affinis]|uniref:C-type lectin 9a-like n=1 Tax=Centroberyx affinis TaxID=166261 RepID=UPI003A5BE06E
MDKEKGGGGRKCKGEVNVTMKTPVVLAMIMFLGVSAQPPSGQGWSIVGRFCVKHFKEKVDFTTAERNCEGAEEEGSRLVSVKEGHENNDLDEYVQNVSPDDTRIWLGGFTVLNPHTGDDFLWLDGTTMKYTNWYPGEPSGDGNCMEMNWRGNGVLYT